MTRPQLTVTQAEGQEPVAPEILAQAIVAISQAFKKVAAGRLKRRAIVLLIHDACGVGKPDISRVLDSLEALEERYVTAPAKRGATP